MLTVYPQSRRTTSHKNTADFENGFLCAEQKHFDLKESIIILDISMRSAAVQLLRETFQYGLLGPDVANEWVSGFDHVGDYSILILINEMTLFLTSWQLLIKFNKLKMYICFTSNWHEAMSTECCVSIISGMMFRTKPFKICFIYCEVKVPKCVDIASSSYRIDLPYNT